MEDSAIVDLYWQRSEQAIAESERKYGTYCSSIAQRTAWSAEIELVLDELTEVLPSESDPAQEFEAREFGEAVSAFVGCLGETERNIFLGRYFFGYPVKTIAARCGYTESRTKSILFRLRGRLRRILETEGLL